MFRLLSADEIECRVKKVTEKGAVVLLYKTARTDMDMLDETVGQGNWSCDYREIKGNLFCGIGIKSGSEWIWKWDCGIESREDGEGNEKKGEASDSFKRAGFKWGIGRELYSAPFTFIPADKMNITNGKTYDTFSVSHVAYDGKKISELVIVNDKRGEEAYRWPKTGGRKAQESTPAYEKPIENTRTKEPPNKPVDPKDNILFVCADCGKTLQPYTDAQGKMVGVRRLAEASKKAFGRTLCVDCAEDEGARMRLMSDGVDIR